ncbi:MAG: hypothetical protein AB8H79_20275 [Myxococcota bacterium]
MRWLILASLAGCSVASPPPGAQASASLSPPMAQAEPTPPIRPLHDWDMAFVANEEGFGTIVLNEIAARIERMPDAERQEVHALTRELTSNCPYSRAVFMAPFALEPAFARLDRSSLPADVQQDLNATEAGLKAHVRALRALGADQLSMPAPTDYLHRFRLELIDSATLAAEADPVSRVLATGDVIDAAVEQMPEPTTEHIRTVEDALVPHVAHRQMLTQAFERWGEDLQKAREKASDPALVDGLDRLIALTDAIRQTGC